MDRDDLLGYLTNDQIAAFLRLIRAGESHQGEDAYRILNGGEYFDAPPWIHPQRVGRGGTSTAAGAYQFVAKTWRNISSRYGLEDFSPQNQDLGAVALLYEHRVIDDILAGRIHEAIRRINSKWIEWECFENPTFFQNAPAIFESFGGRLAGEVSDSSLSGISDPPIAEESEVKPMAPMFLLPLIQAALSAAPDLIRLIGNGERSQKNAAVMDKVAEVAMQVTGAVNEQQATERLQQADTAEKFRQAVRDNFDQWLAMTIKFREMDEASIAQARQFNVAAGRFPVFWGMTFIEILSLLFVLISSIGGGYVLVADFPAEIKGGVITLMLIGGYTGVKEFWFGSSRGSMVKESK